MSAVTLADRLFALVTENRFASHVAPREQRGGKSHARRPLKVVERQFAHKRHHLIRHSALTAEVDRPEYTEGRRGDLLSPGSAHATTSAI